MLFGIFIMKRPRTNKLYLGLLICGVLTLSACSEKPTSLSSTQAFDGGVVTVPNTGLKEQTLRSIDIDKELALLSKRIDMLEAKPAHAKSLTRGLKAFRAGEYIEANFYL